MRRGETAKNKNAMKRAYDLGTLLTSSLQSWKGNAGAGEQGKGHSGTGDT